MRRGMAQQSIERSTAGIFQDQHRTDPSVEQARSVGQPTPDPALFGKNIRAPVVSDLPAGDILPSEPRREPETHLHPSAHGKG